MDDLILAFVTFVVWPRTRRDGRICYCDAVGADASCWLSGLRAEA